MPDPSGPQPDASSAATRSASVDPAEIARFEKLGDQWWDLNGPQKALHRLNQVRVDYLRNLLSAHFADGAGYTARAKVCNRADTFTIAQKWNRRGEAPLCDGVADLDGGGFLFQGLPRHGCRTGGGAMDAVAAG